MASQEFEGIKCDYELQLFFEGATTWCKIIGRPIPMSANKIQMMQPKLTGNVLVFGRRFAWTLVAPSGPHCRTPHSPHSIHSHSAAGPASSQLSSAHLELNKTSRTFYSIRFCSSSTLNSGRDEMEEQGERKEETKQTGLAKERPDYETLYKKEIEIAHQSRLRLRLQDTPKGHQIFSFSRVYQKGSPLKKFFYGPKIMFPGDAYKLVRALDRLVVAFEEKRHRSRKQDAHSQPIADGLLADSLIQSEEFIGKFYRFELGLYYSQSDSLRYQIIAHPKDPNLKKRMIFLPVTTLLGLRMTLANLLEKFDGSQKLDMPKIDDNSPFALGISRHFCSSFAVNSSECELEKQRQEQGKETEESEGLADGGGRGYELVDRKYIEIDPRLELNVNLEKMPDRELLFKIYMAWKEREDNLFFKWNYYGGPRIHIPEAYNIVRALDKLMAALVEEDRRGRSQEAKPIDGRRLAENIIIASEEFDGQLYKFELQLYYQNEYPRYRIIAHPKNLDWKKREISLPAQIIFDFRMILAGLVEKYDGSQRLEMPELKLD